jgi:predicted PhzF superfamily epimerase YddE/YHI9
MNAQEAAVALVLRARVRIFTPARELPFAGHPTVGTAVLLGLRNGGGRDIVLEEGIGAVRCTFESRDGGGSARFTIPHLPAEHRTLKLSQRVWQVLRPDLNCSESAGRGGTSSQGRHG